MSKPTITDATQDTGLLNQPTLRELSETVRFIIPSEDRDFSRPRPNYQAQSLPDSAMLDDNNNASGQDVKAIQEVMRSNPIGPSYPGPFDGKINRKLLDVLLNFQWTIEKKLGKDFPIVSGNSINGGQLAKAFEALNESKKPKPRKEDKEETEEEKKDASVLAFQKFFGDSHPIIGVLYNGPEDGKINDELIAAAQKAENKIGSAIKNTATKGMIWGGAKFVTSTEDVSSALSLIAKHQKSAVA